MIILDTGWTPLNRSYCGSAYQNGEGKPAVTTKFRSYFDADLESAIAKKLADNLMRGLISRTKCSKDTWSSYLEVPMLLLIEEVLSAIHKYSDQRIVNLRLRMCMPNEPFSVYGLTKTVLDILWGYGCRSAFQYHSGRYKAETWP